MTVYMDNAATTRVSDTAVRAMLPCFQNLYGNPSSLHTIGQEAAKALLSARETVPRVSDAASRRSHLPPAAAKRTTRPLFPRPA